MLVERLSYLPIFLIENSTKSLSYEEANKKYEAKSTKKVPYRCVGLLINKKNILSFFFVVMFVIFVTFSKFVISHDF